MKTATKMRQTYTVLGTLCEIGQQQKEDGRLGGRVDSRAGANRRPLPSDRAEGVTDLTYAASLRAQLTMSWAFIPWLRCVFNREDDIIGQLPPELILL